MGERVKLTEATEFYVIDLRPKWLRNPCITLWRPNDAGYAYPLSWAGRYSRERIEEKREYYSQQGARYWQRFAVPCDVVEKLGVEVPKGLVDCWEHGLHVLNTGKNRMALRRNRYRPEWLREAGRTAPKEPT